MSYYTWITEDVAIGELNASYDAFDTIVNIAYINPTVNGIEHGTMVTSYRDGKIIYKIGVYDTDADKDLFIDLLDRTVPLIDGDNILFHCQAGKSRSVCVAMAFICRKTGMSVEECLDLIKRKRVVADPRPAFVEKVKVWLGQQ